MFHIQARQACMDNQSSEYIYNTVYIIFCVCNQQMLSWCYIIYILLSNHLWHYIFLFLHVAAHVEDLVEPCFMIFRFLFESDEALQASVSNRIIIYLLTDSTLTPAHDDPSPSQQQPAHLLPYIDTRCCWLLMLSEESIVPSTSSLLALHGTTDTLLFLF